MAGTTQDGEKRLLEAFNRAVSLFWERADKFESLKNDNDRRAAVMDAADAVLFARDDLGQATLSGPCWDGVVSDVADMAHYLHKNDIHLAGAPQTTSTGRKTYRVLNKPSRFDY